ncbi:MULTISPECIES: heavy metal-responsive transcriptional regulator [Aerosakkonema]|uniref:Heavy metal-responsive transcriptional regulator n=1 Tax=Aerosakkonema funiforme FACHB-1375 TaxID=2949571 RepID=A0A926VAA9_9CYAN|nr:heavy metal-responsive transcriptional regulator [Aerosakkonema funiforme]MBD2179688.1 heavy metal-responsive transcriptional regulator [Aerosakkonema funiforme FACHB-1375]
MNTAVVGKLLKIGEVSASSGLPVKTIRYYEDLGLLSPIVVRSESGYRLFNPLVLKRLDFIKRAQSLGMSLKEIHLFLEIHDRGKLPCREVKQHLEAKIEEIVKQIDALETLKFELQGLLSGWQEQPSANCLEEIICPNIQSEPDEISI